MGRRIAVVGNGPVGRDAAAAVEAADMVIRFNDCRSAGPGLSRTDVVAVCNTGRPALAMLAGGAWKASAPVREAREIWCVRDARIFAALRAPLARGHPDLADFCDDHTLGFELFAKVTGRTCRVIPGQVHAGLDAALAAFEPPPYVVPSSGLVVLAHVLDAVAGAGDAVEIAGFGHRGWAWHPFDAERKWTEARIAEGRLRRLDDQNGAEIRLQHGDR